MRSVVVVVAGLCGVAAHGGMSTPRPRNSFGEDWNQRSRNGQILPRTWTNYYDDGCLAGCDSCLHHGAAMPNSTMNPWGPPINVQCTVDGVPVGPGVFNISLPGADTLPDYARTWNRFNDKIDANPLLGDWQKFQPWRAPGAAKIADPCGILCDHCQDPDDPTRPQLFNGSGLPPLPSPPARWRAGGVAEVGWALMVNHGGGYQYRVCKKGHPITEECFQAGVLPFVDNVTTIRYPNSPRKEFTIPAVDVREGVVPAGSTWRRDPIPACACDSGTNCHWDPSGHSGRGGSYPWLTGFNMPYSNSTTDGPPGCEHGTMFPPPWPEGYGYMSERDGTPAFDYEMVDRVRVPEGAGEYVLSWRWDTEQKSQVWSSCADIVVVE